MLIKITGLGIINYVKDRVNIFDAIVVTLTVADSINDFVTDSNVQNGTASGFRAVRLIRIFRIARQLKSFQVMI